MRIGRRWNSLPRKGIVRSPPEKRVRHRKVVDPAHEGRIAELDRIAQHVVQRDEHGHLEEERKAPAERAHARLLVQLHDLLVEPIAVALVLLLNLLELRLKALHVLHRLEALVREAVEEELRQDGENDDDDAVVRNEPLHPDHELQDADAQEAQPSRGRSSSRARSRSP